MKKTIVIAWSGLILAGFAFWFARNSPDNSNEVGMGAADHIAEQHGTRISAVDRENARVVPEIEESPDPLPLADEEKQAEAEERLVEVFDNLTDKWMETSAKGVAMSDVEAFVKAFKLLPKNRQNECVSRAINLIPDGNVMLLAGLLMDKSLDREIAETIFNDVLNREEDVKRLIVLQVFRDKSHPCWEDAAWVLNATGELPNDNPQ